MQMCTCRGESVGLLFLEHTTGLLTGTSLVVRDTIVGGFEIVKEAAGG